MTEELDDTCHVYIVTHLTPAGNLRGPVKIGITSNMDARIATLQTGNPGPIVIAAYFTLPTRAVAATVELAFHEVMAAHRLKGEWFDMPPLHALRAMCSNMESALKHFYGELPELMEAVRERSLLNRAYMHISEIEALAKARGIDAD